jgi:hypothetical protein
VAKAKAFLAVLKNRRGHFIKSAQALLLRWLRNPLAGHKASCFVPRKNAKETRKKAEPESPESD